MQIEMLDEVIDLRRKYNQYVEALTEFTNSDKKTLKFNCANMREAAKVYSSLRTNINRNNLNMIVYKKLTNVYVLKG